MLLRNSIAKTKRFFHKTIDRFKSFLSGGYERIPKTPSCNPCSCTAGGVGDTNFNQSFRELDSFYRDLTNRWDSSDPDKAKKGNKKKPPAMLKEQQPIDNEEIYGGSFLKFGNQRLAKIRDEGEGRKETGKEMRIAHVQNSHNSHGGGEEIGSDIHSESNGKERGGQLVVVEKLKELEMMDASDMEHVLDIEEVLHYYSRLTCPAYRDIVNKFFMDMYSDFFLPQPSSASSSSVNNIYSSRHRI